MAQGPDLGKRNKLVQSQLGNSDPTMARIIITIII